MSSIFLMVVLHTPVALPAREEKLVVEQRFTKLKRDKRKKKFKEPNVPKQFKRKKY